MGNRNEKGERDIERKRERRKKNEGTFTLGGAYYLGKQIVHPKNFGDMLLQKQKKV